MRLSEVRWLFGYDRWATRRILRTARDCPAEVWSAPNAVGDRGLGGILVHALGAHQRWRHDWEGLAGPLPRPEVGPLPTVDELADAWDREWAAIDRYLDGIDDAAMGREQDGVALWQRMAHVVNHGTQHRSEAAALLTGTGRSPGDLDLIFYAAELAPGNDR